MRSHFLVSSKEDLDKYLIADRQKEIQIILADKELSQHMNETTQQECLVFDGDLILNGDGEVVGQKVIINSPKDMEDILSLEIPNSRNYIYIETGDWHIIPIENLIAKFQDSPHELMVKAGSFTEIDLLENILEVGVENLVSSDLDLILAYLDRENFEKLTFLP